MSKNQGLDLNGLVFINELEKFKLEHESVESLCRRGGTTKRSYYNWLKGKKIMESTARDILQSLGASPGDESRIIRKCRLVGLEAPPYNNEMDLSDLNDAFATAPTPTDEGAELIYLIDKLNDEHPLGRLWHAYAQTEAYSAEEDPHAAFYGTVGLGEGDFALLYYSPEKFPIDRLPAIIMRFGLPHDMEHWVFFGGTSAPAFFCQVRKVQFPLAAGAGFEIINELGEPYAFQEQWLRSICSAINNCVVMTVRGDSMFPELRDGDLVLVDRGRTKITDGHIYAFEIHHRGAVVKRLEVGTGEEEGKIVVISDNKPAYSDEIHPAEDISVFGEVLWLGRDFYSKRSLRAR